MDYTSKIISLEKALSLVKSGDIVVTGLGASEAGLFMENIHTLAGSVKGVKIVNCNPTHSCEFYKPEYADTFSVDGWFYAPAMRRAHEQGNMAQPSPPGRHKVALPQQAEHLRRRRLYARQERLYLPVHLQHL